MIPLAAIDALKRAPFPKLAVHAPGMEDESAMAFGEELVELLVRRKVSAARIKLAAKEMLRQTPLRAIYRRARGIRVPCRRLMESIPPLRIDGQIAPGPACNNGW